MRRDVARPETNEARTESEKVSRRRVFGLFGSAATAGAGAVAVSSLVDAQYANAGTMIFPASQDGDAMQVGGNNTNTVLPTTLVGPATNTFMLKVANSSATGTPVALSGEQTNVSAAAGAGVSGVASGAQAAGVVGNSTGANGYGLKGVAATGASLLLVDSGVAMPPPSGTWVAGSFVVSGGDLWYCRVGGVGAASTWIKLSAAAPPSTFVPLVSPARVFDSRSAAPLEPGEERAVTVTGTFGVTTIPPGISAVLTNLTCAGPIGSGYLAMFKDGTDWSGTSNVNFSPDVDISNNATSAVSGAGKVRVLCGGTGPTHFVVDVFGYYV